MIVRSKARGSREHTAQPVRGGFLCAVQFDLFYLDHAHLTPGGGRPSKVMAHPTPKDRMCTNCWGSEAPPQRMCTNS